MSERYDDKVLHAMSCTIYMLAQGRNMSIVAQRHSQTDSVAQHSSQRYYAFPRHIGGILNTSRQIVGTGCTDTYRADILESPISFSDKYDTLAEYGQEIVHVRIVSRQETVGTQNIATLVNNSYHRTFLAYVNSYDSILYGITHGVYVLNFSPSHLNNEYSFTSQASTEAPSTLRTSSSIVEGISFTLP